MTETYRDKILAEAAYKERLAKDLDRCGAWQADLMFDAVRRLRESVNG